METHSRTRRRSGACVAPWLMVWLTGCIAFEGGGEKLYNSLAGVQTVVVAPMMNLSTSANVDTVEVTKAFASELEQVEGVNVVPLGRVYQYLSVNNMATVGSPEEARALAQVFKAQATLVGAVTEYDPYDPPRMGLSVQMYAVAGLPAASGSEGFDPVSSARSAVPFPVTDDASGRPRDMVSRVFSGRDLEVKNLAKLYAKRRLSDNSPYGWRRFLVDQREYQRLCCYGVIREMLGEESRQAQPTAIKIGPDARKWPK